MNALSRPLWNGFEISWGKKRAAGEQRLAVGAERRRARGRRAGAGSGCSRGRRRTGPRSGGRWAALEAAAAGTPWAVRPLSSVWGSVPDSPIDHQREEDPDRDHLGGVLEGLVHPPAGAAVALGQAVHHGRAVGRGEHPHRDPVEGEDGGEQRIREVDRQQQQQREADRARHHPAAREPPRPEAVRQVAGGGAADQHPDRQRQDVDAGPQGRVGEVVAVLGQPDPLQPDDQHEHQPAARDRRQERGERAEAEGPDAEQG